VPEVQAATCALVPPSPVLLLLSSEEPSLLLLLLPSPLKDGYSGIWVIDESKKIDDQQES